MDNYLCFEQNSYGDDASLTFGIDAFGVYNKAGQTIVAGTHHTCYVVVLKLMLMPGNLNATGNFILKVYNVDSSSNPTGAAIATATTSMSGLTGTPANFNFTLSTPVVMDGTKKAFIIESDIVGVSAGYGLRYQQVGQYTAGEVLQTSDSGATWTVDSSASCIFQEWGIPTPTLGTYQIRLVPYAAGNYTQLYPNPSILENWQCAADFEDFSKYVMYSLKESAAFQSGSGQGVAGTITGTCLFKTHSSSLLGSGTTFTDRSIGDIIRPTEVNEYLGITNRNQQVKSIEGDGDGFGATAVGITFNPCWEQYNASDRPHWFRTPRNDAASKDGKYYVGNYDQKPAAALTGTWTWPKTAGTPNHWTLTGVGGNAVVELQGVSYIGKKNANVLVHEVIDANTIVVNTGSTVDYSGSLVYISFSQYETDTVEWCSQYKEDSYLVKNTLNAGFIHSVAVEYKVGIVPLGDYVFDEFGVKREATIQGLVSTGTTSRTQYLEAGDYRLVFNVLKTSNSGIMVLTFNGTTIATIDLYSPANIVVGQEVLFTSSTTGTHTFAATATTKNAASSGYLFYTSSIDIQLAAEISGKAKPFIRLSSTDTYGTEVTVVSERYPVGGGFYKPQFQEYIETIARPGGGAWSLSDLNSIEPGIRLGGFDYAHPAKGAHEASDPYINEDAGIAGKVTALVVTIAVTAPGEYTGTGLNLHGFPYFDNGLDSWGQEVFDNGLNSLHWEVFPDLVQVGGERIEVIPLTVKESEINLIQNEKIEPLDTWKVEAV